MIICGNCLELIPRLDDDSIDGILIDPPYGEQQDYVGDDNIKTAESLLLKFIQVAKPKLKQNGHIACFWTMRNLDVCIEAIKTEFLYRRTLSMYIPRGNARPYLGWLPRTQAIVIAQKYLPKKPSDFHEDMASYLYDAVIRSGLSKSEIARRLGCDSRLVMKWTRVNDPSWCIPTPRFYKPLKELLSLDDTFDILLTRENSREPGRTFSYHHDCYIVSEEREERFHDAQKPLSVVRHLVECLAPKGGTILDGFAGSGTTAMACLETNRKFICYEISSEFCAVADRRLNARLH